MLEMDSMSIKTTIKNLQHHAANYAGNELIKYSQYGNLQKRKQTKKIFNHVHK
jgi:hypothetical protein